MPSQLRTVFFHDFSGTLAIVLPDFPAMITSPFPSDYFYPLKSLSDIIYNVPQTFPIVILKGNRDKIYDMMNEKGYGVVSLYHTLIDELQSEVYKDTLWLSQNILNLPLHQDVDDNFYKAMMDQLINCMKELEQYDKNF